MVMVTMCSSLPTKQNKKKKQKEWFSNEHGEKYSYPERQPKARL
jgi:hypothetical protein